MEPESKVCFRVVAAMMERALRVSIDQHSIVAFSSDGHDFRPTEVQALVVHPGETFDFAIQTKAARDAGNDIPPPPSHSNRRS